MTNNMFSLLSRIVSKIPNPDDLKHKIPPWVKWIIILSGWIAFCFNSYSDWAPKIVIEAEVSHFPSNPLGTSFRISNVGKVELHNLHFSCILNKTSDGDAMAVLKDNYPGQEPINVFPSGDIATRDCGTSILGLGNPSSLKTIDLTISYQWFLSKEPKLIEKHFVVKRGEDGSYFAVPDHQDHPWSPNQ